ncbi:MAG: hypothetical protein AB1512_17705 [Thermodesulfobacteriota bacterium]
MRNSGAPKELLAIRNAAACIKAGARPPYRLRKQGKTAGLLRPWHMDGDEPSSSGSTAEAVRQGPLRGKQDLS